MNNTLSIHKNNGESKSYSINYFLYNSEKLESGTIKSLGELKNLLKKDSGVYIWIELLGIFDTTFQNEVSKILSIHPVVLSDILNIKHRPKIETYTDYVFIIAKSFYTTELNQIASEQVSIILKDNVLFTFHNHQNPNFSNIKQRLEDKSNRLRTNSIDFLLYSLMDNFVDSYFLYFDKISKSLENIEEQAIKNVFDVNLNDIYKRRKELIFIKKYIWPTRDLINYIIKNEPKYFHQQTVVYFKDILDHLYELVDLLEQHNDSIANLLSIYMTSITTRTNDIMKTLTIFTTIFIPLTFLTGIYGMNFRYMPELYFKWSYPILLFIMLLISIILIVYFKRKKWF
jgi:magnesium transporter